MKKTKIICSIGPASNNIETFRKMVDAGMNVARVNFSHATLEERKTVIDLVKRVNEEKHYNIGLLFDTKGPEFRNGEVKQGGINLIPGHKIKITKEEVIGDEERFSVNHPEAIDSLELGSIIQLENGLMKIKVVDKKDNYVECLVLNFSTKCAKEIFCKISKTSLSFLQFSLGGI